MRGEMAVKERPILFSGEMVRALLAGDKTQTRRVVKNVPTNAESAFMTRDSKHLDQLDVSFFDGPNFLASRCISSIKSPYGQSGDRLWVRETWMTVDTTGSYGDLDAIDIAYRATDDQESSQGRTTHFMSEEKAAPYSGANFSSRWRPSIHMPRWASRINLEITDVRVERLHAIKDCPADVLAEGLVCVEDRIGPHYGLNAQALTSRTAWGAYSVLWERINGKGSWDANPFVWVVTFKVVTA